MNRRKFYKLLTVRSWLLTKKITPYNCKQMQEHFMCRVCSLTYDAGTETFLETMLLSEQDWETLDFLYDRIQSWIRLDRMLREKDQGGAYGG